MRHPQVLVFESDGRLAGILRETAAAQHWSLQEPRRPDSCLRLLRPDNPSVLVLRLANELVDTLTLLERVAWIYPGTAVLAVTDTDDPAVIGLAWDLGASYVLYPPQSQQRLPEIVAGLMQSSIHCKRLASASSAKRETGTDGGIAHPG